MSIALRVNHSKDWRNTAHFLWSWSTAEYQMTSVDSEDEWGCGINGQISREEGWVLFFYLFFPPGAHTVLYTASIYHRSTEFKAVTSTEEQQFKKMVVHSATIWCKTLMVFFLHVVVSELRWRQKVASKHTKLKSVWSAPRGHQRPNICHLPFTHPHLPQQLSATLSVCPLADFFFLLYSLLSRCFSLHSLKSDKWERWKKTPKFVCCFLRFCKKKSDIISIWLLTFIMEIAVN